MAEAAAELAHHWFAAHDLERALAASVEAAELATRRWGFGEARVHCERALELWDRVDPPARPLGGDRVLLLRRAAEAANLEGDHRRAAELMRAALALVDEAAEAERAGVLYTRLGRFLWAAGDSLDALGAYERAIELVPADPPSHARGRVLAARGQALMLTARYAESADCCREAIAIAQRTGARAVEGHAMNTLGVDLAYLGDSDGAVSQLREARAIAEEVGDLDDLARAHLNLADTLVGVLGRPAEAVEEARLGVERCRALGLARDYGVSLQAVAAVGLLELGRWDEAEAVLRDAAAANPIEMAAVDVLHTRIPLLVGRGEFDRAGEDLARARAADDPHDRPAVRRAALCERGRAGALARAPGGGARGRLRGPRAARRHRRHEPDRAAAVARGLDRGRPRRPRPRPALRRPAGRVRGGSGAPARASPLARELRRHDAGLRRAVRGRVGTRAPSLRPFGVVACGRRLDRSRAPLPGGLRPLAPGRGAPGGSPRPRRRADSARGARHRPATRRRAAGARARAPRPPSPHVARGRFRAGARRAPDADHELTPRELEVLTLVAAGRTNREIAEALFVSEKTAGHHVSSILRKLGVRSRVEAAGAAQRLGLVD